METKLAFETTSLRVIIDDITLSGSAFGAAENGDTVFFHQRLVDKMSLEIGDIIDAHSIPNYEDKRHVTPWRAIKVVAQPLVQEDLAKAVKEQEEAALVRLLEETAKTAAQVDADILHLLTENPPAGHWTTVEVGEHVGVDTKAAGNSCLRLFNAGRIAKADVFSSPGQGRASFCLWAINADVFR